jgi:hypothetical protein
MAAEGGDLSVISGMDESMIELVDPTSPATLPFEPTSSHTSWKINQITGQQVLVLEIPSGSVNGGKPGARKRVLLPWDRSRYAKRDDVRALLLTVANADVDFLAVYAVSVGRY